MAQAYAIAKITQFQLVSRVERKQERTKVRRFGKMLVRIPAMSAGDIFRR